MTIALFAARVFDGQTILENQLNKAEKGKITLLTPMIAPLKAV
jgi:hypothetical protein